MPNAAFTTLGCKVNQYETQKILDSFEQDGFTVVPFDSAADVYVINSCSVTSEAERKSRYMIRKASRANPDAKIVVTGCAGQMALNQGEDLDGASLVVPNPEKLETLQHFYNRFPELKPAELPLAPSNQVQGRTRATLKIQDGCNVMCSYCSIPFTRPKMTSRPWREVLAEAQKLAAMGYHEAILTGVLIGAYGPDTGSDGLGFEELVTLLAQESGLARIRISSIEMHQVTPAIIQMATEGTLVPHFHIPLQSGDDTVLRDMNRRYLRQDYIDLCARIRAEIPDVSITTDCLVGFPTETEECFANTAALFEEVGFHSAHIFSFSPRWGTPADRWGDPVTSEVKSQRRTMLSGIANRTGRAHNARFVGRTLRVLFEGKVGKDGLLQGLSDNYLSVKSAGPATMARTLQWVRLDEYSDGHLLGEIVERPSRLSLTAT